MSIKCDHCGAPGFFYGNHPSMPHVQHEPDCPEPNAAGCTNSVRHIRDDSDKARK